MKSATKILIGALTAAAAGMAPSVAAADEVDLTVQLDPASLEGDVRGYYEGERISTYIVGGMALGAIGASIPLVLQDGDLARGAGWSLLAVGAIQAIGALIYAFQVGAQIEHYSSSLARDAAAFQVEETAHLRGTMDRFVIYLVTELTLTLGGAGLATYGFVAGEDVWAGIGIGVAALALPLLIIDVINQQRATQYADRVRRMELPAPPSNGLDRALGPSLDAFVVSTSRAF